MYLLLTKHEIGCVIPFFYPIQYYIWSNKYNLKGLHFHEMHFLWPYLEEVHSLRLYLASKGKKIIKKYFLKRKKIECHRKMGGKKNKGEEKRRY